VVQRRCSASIRVSVASAAATRDCAWSASERVVAPLPNRLSTRSLISRMRDSCSIAMPRSAALR
jgi:hypothetical protein